MKRNQKFTIPELWKITNDPESNRKDSFYDCPINIYSQNILKEYGCAHCPLYNLNLPCGRPNFGTDSLKNLLIKKFPSLLLEEDFL